MNHIVMFSGRIGSWAAARSEAHPARLWQVAADATPDSSALSVWMTNVGKSVCVILESGASKRAKPICGILVRVFPDGLLLNGVVGKYNDLPGGTTVILPRSSVRLVIVEE